MDEGPTEEQAMQADAIRKIASGAERDRRSARFKISGSEDFIQNEAFGRRRKEDGEEVFKSIGDSHIEVNQIVSTELINRENETISRREESASGDMCR